MNYITIQNNNRVTVSSIPLTSYDVFMETVISLLESKDNHCVNYFGFPSGSKLKLICCIADDGNHSVHVMSALIDREKVIPSLTAHHLSFEKFEREIHENYGIRYTGHPWLKPVRYPFDRHDKSVSIGNYPFYTIESEELHEVGVGPIHAGIIEPGHFRFICNGEQIIHLEIQLGYQHRGIESLMVSKKKLLQRVLLAESIAGDTVVGHTTTFANLWESLCNYTATPDLQFARTLALEHERIAIHTGDLSALCTDIAYQLGSSVLGRLRTPLINYFQEWCGNRLAKGLIRPGRTNFPFTEELTNRWRQVIGAYEPHFTEMAGKIFDLPSVLARFEKTGVVSEEDATSVGTVGMVARTCGINRDIRHSHPYGYYSIINYEPVIETSGDVLARARIRMKEINRSIAYIKTMIKNKPGISGDSPSIGNPLPDSFALSLTEGWRGEICHCAVTDAHGDLLHYKIKDPSHHNWMALALAVRNNEISDFPVCNKSFNLSYCGHDL